MSLFDLDVLTAITEWQRGGTHPQKLRRGAALKEACSRLPQRFRTCDRTCYRQEAHEKDRVWQLLADEALPETIAAWTTSLPLAKAFKGGVPPVDLQGVIFAMTPSDDQIVVNLQAVYADPEFKEACRVLGPDVPGYALGIGKYGDTQSEVVLDVEKLGTDAVISYGGFSNTVEGLAALYLGHPPSPDELELFTATVERSNVQPGPWWLSEDGTRRVLDRMAPRITSLRGTAG